MPRPQLSASEAGPEVMRAGLATLCGAAALGLHVVAPPAEPAFWAAAVVLATLSPAGLLAPLAAGLIPVALPLRAAIAAAGLAAWLAARHGNRRMARLEQRAFVDRLTGLYRYDFFCEALEHELRRARRYDEDLSLILCDLDDFKAFNDRFGHNTGNLMLSRVGSALRRSVRESDLACRFGGEELAVLVRGDGRCAARLAQRIGQAVEAIELDAQRGPAKTTLSAGVAAFDPSQDARDLLEAADAALYEAKRRGKNRVVLSASRARARSRSAA